VHASGADMNSVLHMQPHVPWDHSTYQDLDKILSNPGFLELWMCL
jgi:hypothetical protein